MDKYTETLDKVGEAILTWADPENKYRGHTEVSLASTSMTMSYSMSLAL